MSAKPEIFPWASCVYRDSLTLFVEFAEYSALTCGQITVGKEICYICTCTMNILHLCTHAHICTLVLPCTCIYVQICTFKLFGQHAYGNHFVYLVCLYAVDGLVRKIACLRNKGHDL